MYKHPIKEKNRSKVGTYTEIYFCSGDFTAGKKMKVGWCEDGGGANILCKSKQKKKQKQKIDGMTHKPKSKTCQTQATIKSRSPWLVTFSHAERLLPSPDSLSMYNEPWESPNVHYWFTGSCHHLGFFSSFCQCCFLLYLIFYSFNGAHDLSLINVTYCSFIKHIESR